jgi:hypothetical protein
LLLILALRPLFIRLTEALDLTGTFKVKKVRRIACMLVLVLKRLFACL